MVPAYHSQVTSSGERPRRTPLHAVHERLGAVMVPFAGWQMPLRYGSETAEHNAVRTAAGLFESQGYTSTSTRTIADAVGLRQASLFHYFARKEDILTELLDRTVRSAGEAGVKLSAPLLGVVPFETTYRGVPRADERVPGPFRALAIRIMRNIPKRNARLLLISARQGEGVSTVSEVRRGRCANSKSSLPPASRSSISTASSSSFRGECVFAGGDGTTVFAGGLLCECG